MNRVGTGVYMREATSEGRMEIHEVIQDGGAQLTGMEIYSDRLPRLPEGGEEGGCKLRHSLLPLPAALSHHHHHCLCFPFQHPHLHRRKNK